MSWSPPIPPTSSNSLNTGRAPGGATYDGDKPREGRQQAGEGAIESAPRAHFLSSRDRSPQSRTPGEGSLEGWEHRSYSGTADTQWECNGRGRDGPKLASSRCHGDRAGHLPGLWVALGPTVSSWEVELPDGAIVRQHQLTFARRALLPGLRSTDEGSLDTGAGPGSSAPPSLRLTEPVPSTAEIRAWAREQGRVVSRCGPLSAEVRRAFDEAHVARPMPTSPNATRGSIAGVPLKLN